MKKIRYNFEYIYTNIKKENNKFQEKFHCKKMLIKKKKQKLITNCKLLYI